MVLRLALTRTVCGLLLSTQAVIIGCGNSPELPEAPRLGKEYTGASGEKSLDGRNPIVWEPYTVEQQRALLAGFSWADTQPLPSPPADSAEPPPLYYVQIYVRNADELRELDEMGVHYDLAPLFTSAGLNLGGAVVSGVGHRRRPSAAADSGGHHGRVSDGERHRPAERPLTSPGAAIKVTTRKKDLSEVVAGARLGDALACISRAFQRDPRG